jgi:nudix-type nucleoside diphosphatase (YffH/AdpP family)
VKNERIRNIKKEELSDNWYTLNNYNFDYQREDGSWETQQRESYDCGDGAAILLYNRERKTVILTRQFRIPTYVNGNDDGMMVEVCAGLLEELSPEECIKKEALEETGYKINEVQQVMVTFMCPGSVTQKLYLFMAAYDSHMKVAKGGGALDETENIEVLEFSFTKALDMISNGEIKDAKSIMLLQHAALTGIFES